MESTSAVLQRSAVLDLVPAAPAVRDEPRVAAAVRPLAVVLLAATILAGLHALLLGTWLIDDAGITFAYARNLALGHGLVSQPGVAPVEGFSNPLWTLFFVPFFAVGLFDPVWTPKLVSLALVAATLAAIVGSVRASGTAAWLAASGALLLALDTSFVIWTTSGLENPLLAVLLAASAALALRAQDAPSRTYDIAAGVVAALLALTRPDATLYAAAYPAVRLVQDRDRLFATLRTLALPYAAAFLAPFTGYFAFRRLYFGDWVPNTYYAKVRPWLMETDPARVLEPATAALGPLAVPALTTVAAVAIAGLCGARWGRRSAVLAVYLALAAVAYVLMPPDWMGEHRFATAFFIFLYWALGEALSAVWMASTRTRARLLVPGAAVAALLVSASAHAARTTTFAAAPTVPLDDVASFARAYDGLAAELGPGPHSLLTPDLGGMLFYANVRVYDLAGLCDRTIARTLMGDGPRFRDYVFETARPTFIHVHATWADWAALHTDPRLARDYVALHERWTRPQGAPAGKGEPWAGDYVRRDALRSPADRLRLVDAVRRLGIDRPLR